MIEITTHPTAFAIKTPFPIKDRVKQIPGAKWNKAHRVWNLPATHCAAVQLCAEFPDIDQIRADNAFWQKFEPKQVPNFAHMRTTLWGHQVEAVRHALTHDGACLWMAMGTGKSACAVAVACQVAPVNVLVLCPLAVTGVWPREFRKHSGDRYAVWRPEGSTSARKAKDLLAFMQLNTVKNKPHVVAINYESAVTEAISELLLMTRWNLIVFDEIHRIKAPGGKRSKFCERLGQRADRRLGLTGTLMHHSPLDTYAQLRALDRSVFGSSYVLFKRRYCVENQFGGPAYYINQDEMIGRVRMITYEADASVLDLPEATHSYLTCQLEPEAKRTYKELEQELFVEIDEGTITPANALVKLLRLQQITSGTTRNDAGEMVQISTAKEDLLRDTLEDIDRSEKVVVVCKFRPDIDRVERAAEAMGLEFGAICGDRKDGLDENSCFNTDKDIVAVQIASGGEGTDLTAARYCILLSVGGSLGQYEQMIKRLHRPGQKRPVYYLHLLCESTVDRNVYYSLRKHRSVIDDLVSRHPEMELEDL